METTLERVREIVVYVMPEIQADITAEDRLEEDLGIDSLSLVEILVQVEKRFFLTLDDSELIDVASVQDILDVIQRREAVAGV
ncbi:acyl carrier protein [Streptomyces sp. NP-1717]|uniref:acyl carrier protein n=1 Tax=unclassified Streptomyces TaxID=2593676 RepID=UPI001F5D9C51|nr:acyl carrier protein [Streptomyces sp. NP-1717]MCI3224713.1 acyl carrier protein [Streptomyces sp. NP-1717]WTA77379.1 acyl carrier protein [Streptomyces sp. NBC_00838]